MPFDPSQFGATPADQGFDPKKFGAVPVAQPKSAAATGGSGGGSGGFPSPTRAASAPDLSLAGMEKRAKDMLIAPPAQRDKSLAQALGEGITAAPGEAWKGLKGGVSQLGSDLMPSTPEDLVKTLALGPAGTVASDIMGIPFGTASAALTSAAGRPVEQQTGVRREITGNLLAAALPFAARGRGIPKEMDVPRETIEPGAAAKDQTSQTGQTKPSTSKALTVRAPGQHIRPERMAEDHVPPDLTDKDILKVSHDIDDILYRVQTNNEADKIAARHYLEDLPKEEADPGFQERAYTEIERRKIDPASPLSPDVQKFMGGEFGKWYARQQDLYKRIKGLPVGKEVLDTDSLPDTSAGYVHRVPKAKGSIYDPGDPEGYQRDSLTGARSLSKRASGLEQRKFFVIEGPDGKRVFLPRERVEQMQKVKTAPGVMEKELTGSDGKKYLVKQATTEEVERETANPTNGYSPVQYRKNLLVNTVENVLRLERVHRAMIVTDGLKTKLGELGLMKTGDEAAPEGFIPSRLPQFMGARLHPYIAAALNDFAGATTDAADASMWERINRFLTRAIFFNPIPHLLNVGTFWTIGRGFDWARPQGWVNLVKNGGRAIQDVANQGPITQRLLRQGNALQYPRIANQNFYRLMIERMTGEMQRDPETWGGLIKSFGLRTPKDFVRMVYKTASKAMWLGNDIFMVQRILDLKDRGMSDQQAIAEAEKDIPNYRIPSQMFRGRVGRAASQLLQDPGAIMFGRYKYDQVKMVANLAKDLARTGDRKEALGKAFVMVGLATAVLPLADAALQEVTGNKDARVKRSGPLAPIDALANAKVRGWVSALGSILSPAPGIDVVAEMFSGRDKFGRSIVEPQSSTPVQALQAAEYAAGTIAPVGEAIEATKPGGMARIAGRNFGLDLPPPGHEAMMNKVQRYQKRDARKRERKDEIELAVKRALKAISP